MTTKNANAKASNVVSINAKGDKALPDIRHAADRAKVLEAIDTAEDLLGTALLEGLRMTVRFGLTSKDEVAKHYTRCNNPDVYASWFNRGHKAQLIVGQKLALEAIERAAATAGGAGFTKARDALKAIMEAGKAATGKSDGKLNASQGAKAVKAAVAQASKPKDKAAPAKVARGTKAQDAGTMAKAAMECGKSARELSAFVKLASQNAGRLSAPVGKEQAWRDACKALADASELFAVFSK